jgi:adenine deaminase
VIRKDRDALEKIEAARKARKPVDGHSPGLTGPDLDTYIAAGIGSDHECTRLEEAREKLEKGMQIMIREGTAARNLDALLPIANRYTASRLMWCTDDRHPKDLLEGGHIDGMIRRAIRSGLDPLSAIRMATLTPATYFGISALGAISPGKRADLVVFRDLSAPVIETVYRSGIRAAENGRVLPGAERPAAKAAPNTMRIDPSRIDFSIPAAGNRIRVIDLVPDQIVTRQSVHPPHVRNGEAVSDITRDILKIVVVERHTGSGRTGYGFVRGFGLRKGALASSVAHDSHNLIIVGVSDADMAAAARGVIAAGGGLAAASEGRILADLPLPIAGLMSHDPLPEVCSKMERLLGAARELGSPLPEPFMPLSFLSLPVIPELKLTDHGLVDVEKFRIVPLFTAD